MSYVCMKRRYYNRPRYVCVCLPCATSLRGAPRSASYRPPVYPAAARSAPLPSGAGSRAGRGEVGPCPRHPRLSPQEASNCKIFSSPLKRNTRERGLQFYIWNSSCPSDSRKGDHPFERPPPDFPLPLSIAGAPSSPHGEHGRFRPVSLPRFRGICPLLRDVLLTLPKHLHAPFRRHCRNGPARSASSIGRS